MKTFRIKASEKHSLATEVYYCEARNLLDAVVKARRKMVRDHGHLWELETAELVSGVILKS